MVDTLVNLVGAPVVNVFAQPIADTTDDVAVTLLFRDGSVGTIAYASGGDRSMPKEHLEVLGGGRSAVLDDFRTATLFSGGSAQKAGGRLPRQDKGHAAELGAFIQSVRSGGPSAINPEVAAHDTRVTFAIVESVQTGLPVQLTV